MQRAILLAFLLFIAGPVAGCFAFEPWGDPEESEVNPKPAILAHECKIQLAAGEYEKAKVIAVEVVKGSLMADGQPAVDQAVFCYTTANTLSRINEISRNLEGQLGLIAGLLNGSGGLSLSPKRMQRLAGEYVNGRLDPQAVGAIGLFLDTYLGSVQSLLEENAELLEFIIGRNQFQWHIDALPLKIADKQLIDAGGRYDLGELQMLYGLTRGLLGLIYMVQSQDYAITLAIVQYALTATTNNPLLALSDNPVRALSNAYAVLMATSPKFLMLDPNVGAAKMKAAGKELSLGFNAILHSVVVMRERPLPIQPEHVIEVKTARGQDYFVLHMQFENLVPFVDLRKLDGVAIPIGADFVAGLVKVASDLNGDRGVNTNLQRDVFPLAALVAVSLMNSGVFENLISLALEDADPETEETISRIVGLVAENPDLLLAALVTTVPLDIELDLGHVFKNPVGLREIFPAWVYPDVPSTSKDAAYYQAFTAATVVYSYECVDDVDPIVTGDLLCANPADGDHFKQLDATPYVMWSAPGVTWSSPDIRWENFNTGNFGTLWDAQAPILKDGVVTGIPYLGWKDATFGGLLYLDVTSINQSGLLGANGIKKANLQTLNATIASIFATVESFF